MSNPTSFPLLTPSFPRKRESREDIPRLDSRFRGNDVGDGNDEKNMLKFIQEENKKIRKGSLWRTLSVLKSSRCNEIVLDGHKLLNFSSNDYLGYSHHPQVLRAAQAALRRYGAGGRSSRLISGSLEIHRELEEKLAKFKGTESSLVFPTGFMANLGVISALLGEGDAVLMDRLNHASLIDAAKLSRARLFVYSHCSVESLDRVLRRTRSYRKRLVVTDSLFSMDGDFAPLKEIREICSREKVWLMIDDAHATG
ncbi:MAG: aminotransferase class I/II-fold pyridoxal phosphate-dependent enzyme, partial [Elusimicrobia bacterium]|nr:aminotransferase class I/II-fold pyridoxal phosphate-dependent enzyme [Elusimicrobiota bacterium]